YEIASKKFAVQRDVVTRYLGRSPYEHGSTVFILLSQNPHRVEFQSKGRFRFVNMEVGEAATMVLRESTEPITLDEIVATLQRGGMGTAFPNVTRSVNASLINKAGIEKTEDGKYSVQREEDDLDSIPF